MSAHDISSLPYAAGGDLDIAENERIVVDDIVDFYRDLVRLGEESEVMREVGPVALAAFTDIFRRQINAIYKRNPLRALESQTWPGVICQPFVFGQGKVDWTGADELAQKSDSLLQLPTRYLASRHSCRVHLRRRLRILTKTGSTSLLATLRVLRDADEALADLRAQGF